MSILAMEETKMGILPTIKEFQQTLDMLRKEYPFTDEARINVVDIAYATNHTRLTLSETDKETGIEVVMSREYVGHENGQSDE